MRRKKKRKIRVEYFFRKLHSRVKFRQNRRFWVCFPVNLLILSDLERLLRISLFSGGRNFGGLPNVFSSLYTKEKKKRKDHSSVKFRILFSPSTWFYRVATEKRVHFQSFLFRGMFSHVMVKKKKCKWSNKKLKKTRVCKSHSCFIYRYYVQSFSDHPVLLSLFFAARNQHRWERKV